MDFLNIIYTTLGIFASAIAVITGIFTAVKIAKNFYTRSQQKNKSPIYIPDSIRNRDKPKRGLGKQALLVALVLIIAGSLGLFYLGRIVYPVHNATTVAQAHLTQTSQAIDRFATATVIVQDNATATAFAPTVTAATTASQNPYPPHLGTLALNDPLSDNTKGYGWYENTNCVFTEGSYHASGYCAAASTNYSNFTFQVQMTIIQGSYGGIMFRIDNAKSNYYYFRLGRYGSYVFYSYVNRVTRTTSGSTSFFHRDLNQTNLIAVVARGNKLDLYVNLQYIMSVNDSNLTHGEIAVVADNVIDATEVVFSNAKVWRL